MLPENEWDSLRGTMRTNAGSAGIGILRISLLFGSAAIALGLIIAPLANDQTKKYMARNATPGIDTISTGSINSREKYTVRRSVLQDQRDSFCIIRANGTRSGDC